MMRKERCAELRLALAPVAGHARPVVDQRELLPDEPVEQGRLADIRPADDRDRPHRTCPIASSGRGRRPRAPCRSRAGPRRPCGVSRSAAIWSNQRLAPSKSPRFRAARPSSSRAVWRQGLVGVASRSRSARRRLGIAAVEAQHGGPQPREIAQMRLDGRVGRERVVGLGAGCRDRPCRARPRAGSGRAGGSRPGASAPRAPQDAFSASSPLPSRESCRAASKRDEAASAAAPRDAASSASRRRPRRAGPRARR